MPQSCPRPCPSSLPTFCPFALLSLSPSHRIALTAPTMLSPFVARKSQELLRRFFQREGRHVIKVTPPSVSSTPSDPSSSSSSSSSSASSSTLPTPRVTTYEWTTSYNPFKAQIYKNELGHVKYRGPKYSSREQKRLIRAMEVVKLQQILLEQEKINPDSLDLSNSTAGPASQHGEKVQSSKAKRQAAEREERRLNKSKSKPRGLHASIRKMPLINFKIPDHWVLPESEKAKKMTSFFDSPSSSDDTTSSSSSPEPSIAERLAINAERAAKAEESAAIAATAAIKARHSQLQQRRPSLKEATSRGPYKGRMNQPFILHEWERNKEKRMADRKAKLDAMPARIAEYKKVSLLTLHYSFLALFPHMLLFRFPLSLSNRLEHWTSSRNDRLYLSNHYHQQQILLHLFNTWSMHIVPCCTLYISRKDSHVAIPLSFEDDRDNLKRRTVGTWLVFAALKSTNQATESRSYIMQAIPTRHLMCL